MYEHQSQRPIAGRAFARRLLAHVLGAIALLGVSLGIGMGGYVGFEGLALDDAFLNAAMLLGGMGPVAPLQTHAGKIFAGVYALYAGLVFLLASALILTPLAHRALHRFHWDERL